MSDLVIRLRDPQRIDCDMVLLVAEAADEIERLSSPAHMDAIREKLAQTIVEQEQRIAALEAALIEMRERIIDHPAYAELTPDEEEIEGGDTAELSYLVRIANYALSGKELA